MGAISGLFGGFDALLNVLLAAIVIDYISGILLALYGKSTKTPDGKLSSAVGAKGIAKKGMIMLTIILAHMLDTAMGANTTFRNATILFYIANESLSFLENLNTMGIPFPQKIKSLLSEMHSKDVNNNVNQNNPNIQDINKIVNQNTNQNTNHNINQ